MFDFMEYAMDQPNDDNLMDFSYFLYQEGENDLNLKYLNVVAMIFFNVLYLMGYGFLNVIIKAFFNTLTLSSKPIIED